MLTPPFLQGRYRDVVNSSSQSDEKILSRIGAHCFLGETLHAGELYRQSKQKLSLDEKAGALFFQSIALMRKARFVEAKSLLIDAYKISRHHRSHWSLFFASQGFSFYYYYVGRFGKAQRWVLRSHRAALKTKHLYPQILSEDLLGHCSIEEGRIYNGIDSLNQAASKARKIKNKGTADAIETSVLIYQSEFGLSVKTIFSDLKSRRDALETEDSYTYVNLSLEIARQLNLSGQFGAAKLELERVMPLIFAQENRRQEVNWGLILSENQLFRGNAMEAQMALRSSRNLIKVVIDPHFQKKIQIQESKIQFFLETGRLSESLIQGEQGSNHRINTRTRENQIIVDFERCLLGENKFKKVKDLQYWSWLFYFSELKPGQSAIYILAKTNSYVILDSKGFSFHEKGLTDLFQRVLQTLSLGATSKRSLFESVWGLNYIAKYDNVLHSTMKSLRKILPQNWLQTTDDGYQLSPLVVVVNSQENEVESADLPKLVIPLSHDLAAQGDTELNLRQMQALELLRGAAYVSVAHYRQKFQVSNMTAFRDLKLMVDKGLLRKLGSGRATRYVSAVSL